MEETPRIKSHIKLRITWQQRMRRRMRDATFPIPPWTGAVFVSMVLALHLKEIETIHPYSGFMGCGQLSELFGLTIFALFVWMAMIFVVRSAITMALYYKGWLYDPMGKPSRSTKIFMGLITMLQKQKPTFQTFQGLLPARPLPAVSRTVELYLKSVKPIMSSTEYAATVKMADEFLKNEGNQIQSRLYLKWLTSANYMDDWWKTYAYNAQRDSLLMSNYAGCDTILRKQTATQAARAANIIFLHQMYMNDVARNCEVTPVTMGGIPLCSSQYQDLSAHIRRAKIQIDRLDAITTDTTYTIIWFRNVFYKLEIYHEDRCLRPYEIQLGIEKMMSNAQQPSCEEEGQLGAITAAQRDHVAQIRMKHFSDGLNKESLNVIENAQDMIFLTDDDDIFYSESDPSKLDHQYRLAFGGDGYKIWLERPTHTTINKLGNYRCNGEHGVADALITCHMVEYMKYYENLMPEFGYDKNGNCIDQTVEHVPGFERIDWIIDDELKTTINECVINARKIIDNIDNAALIFTEYGKNFMKSISVSPDAFIQMALQYTYYKEMGQFDLTYESAMARLYSQGRTETVRTCSEESCNFVLSMTDGQYTKEERLMKLRKACNAHQVSYKRAMAGDACDRHLFAMYIVTNGLNIESPFLKKAMESGFPLSTSQTPQHQVPEMMKELNNHPELFWPAGAFLPPAKCNYGVCYTVGPGGNQLSFHISTWKSSERTDAASFRQNLTESLREMRALAPSTSVDGNHLYDRQQTVFNALHSYKK